MGAGELASAAMLNRPLINRVQVEKVHRVDPLGRRSSGGYRPWGNCWQHPQVTLLNPIELVEQRDIVDSDHQTVSLMKRSMSLTGRITVPAPIFLLGSRPSPMRANTVERPSPSMVAASGTETASLWMPATPAFVERLDHDPHQTFEISEFLHPLLLCARHQRSLTVPG